VLSDISCQRVGVDPFSWFRDVLSCVAAHPMTRLQELLPHNLAPLRPDPKTRRLQVSARRYPVTQSLEHSGADRVGHASR
jgi:hypothetical protein